MKYPTHTPAQIQALMAQFAYEMLKWIAAETPEGKPFSKWFGLCANWNFFLKKPDYDLNEMFYETIFGLNDNPFNDYKSRKMGNLYNNPLRIKWLQAHAKRHNPARRARNSPKMPQD